MKKTACLILAVFCAAVFCSCGSTIRTREDLSGKRIGVIEGSTSEPYAALYGNVTKYSGKKEIVNALKQGDVECIVADKLNSGKIKKFSFLNEIKEPLAESHLRIAVAKENPDLIEDINSSLAYFEEEGILQNIVKANYSGEKYNSSYQEDDSSLPVLTVALGGDFGEYKYVDENREICGIDVDVAREICARLNLRIEFIVVPGNELINTVVTGKAHFALGGITTDSVANGECLLSNEYSTCTQVIITK